MQNLANTSNIKNSIDFEQTQQMQTSSDQCLLSNMSLRYDWKANMPTNIMPTCERNVKYGIVVRPPLRAILERRRVCDKCVHLRTVERVRQSCCFAQMTVWNLILVP